MNPFDQFWMAFEAVSDVRGTYQLVEDNPTPVRAYVHPKGIVCFAEDVQDVDPAQGYFWAMIERDEFQSNNWRVIAAVLYSFAIWELGEPNPLVPAIKADIRQRPDLLACRSFSELHDKCDANCLGGLCDDGHWVWEVQGLSEIAFTDIINHAQTVVSEWLAAGAPDDEED